VHYHSGKANIVANVLSCKTHCNYLPIVPLTGVESNIQVLPDLSLYNITLTPILKDKIIVAEKNDEGMAQMKRRMQEGDLKVNCFCKDMEGTLWIKDRLVVPKRGAPVTPSFKAKLNVHSMCAHESSFHTYCIENGYRITNVTIYNIYYRIISYKRLNQTFLKQQKDTITPQAIDRGQSLS
jgi:hypothetical protein